MYNIKYKIIKIVEVRPQEKFSKFTLLENNR